MKIQPYNKNSKHEEAKQALHNLYEQKNEEENRKKKNTGCEIMNKVRKEFSKFKERIKSLIKQRQDVKELVADRERIDLEAERINKEVERIEKKREELEEKTLKVALKIMGKEKYYKVVKIEEKDENTEQAGSSQERNSRKKKIRGY